MSDKMRKILYLLGTLFFFFFNLINIKASTYIDPVDFEIEDEFYLKVQKQIQNRTTYFTVENSLGAIELTEEQLRTILSRTTLENQSYLTIYSSLNIKVTPLEDTVFESLLNKDKYYLGLSNEIWMYDEVDTDIDPSSEAVVKNLDDDVDIYSGGIIYRSPLDDNWTTEIPNDVNLEGMTLEEQLATLLEIDLSVDEDAVIDAYQDLYSIYGISSGTNSVIRFDFYDVSTSTSSNYSYKTDNLKYLDNRFTVINYQAPVGTTFSEADISKQENEIKPSSIIGFIMIGSVLLTSAIGTVIYLKKNY